MKKIRDEIIADYITETSADSEREKPIREQNIDLFRNCPISDIEMLRNLGLFLVPTDIKKYLFLNEMYKKILNVHGVIIEFGCRWGQNLSLLHSFRSIYEPFNHYRKIIGFDTFSGFPSISDKDGNSDLAIKGGYNVSENYEIYLEKLLRNLEQESPLNNKKKFEIVKGDATMTVDNYLKNNQDTIIALAYFDFDIYEPTKKSLESIKDRLTKGSILVFDELNHPKFPGETIALKEVFGLDKFKIQRNIYSNCQSYIVIE